MMNNTEINNNEENLVHVYEWKAWSGFLYPSLDNTAVRIEAKIRHENADIIKSLVTNKGYFLFHLNLTKTAFFYKDKEELLTRLINRGFTPLNGELRDTSKKYLQSTCERIGINATKATVEGDPEELLITKTNFNHGGKPEKRLQRSEFRRLKLGSNDYNTDIMYPVMERRLIKKNVWSDKNLVVEKYINNKDNYFFRVYKLLNKMVISEVINNNVIKKMTPGIVRTNYYYDLNKNESPDQNPKFTTIIEDIKHLCAALHLDFAALDVVRCDEGKYYIIDVNATPNWGTADQPQILSYLASALKQETVPA